MAYHRWSDDELEVLRANAPEIGARATADLLGLPYEKVRSACTRLGITSVPSGSWWASLSSEERLEQIKLRRWTTSKSQEQLREDLKRNARRRIFDITLKIIEALGGRCVVCGESRPILLQADHVNNDGAAHRRTVARGEALYREILRTALEEPGRLQLLCVTCHHIKTKMESRGWDSFELLTGVDPLEPAPIHNP